MASMSRNFHLFVSIACSCTSSVLYDKTILHMQLLDLNDSKDAVYGALDAWVAWEQKFPIASIKQVLIALEKEQQWHRIVQV